MALVSILVVDFEVFIVFIDGIIRQMRITILKIIPICGLKS
jgi:hypothetical protein